MAPKPKSERPLSLTTPLGRDVLLVAGLTGRESLSSLFRYELDLLAPNEQPVPFEALLGRPMTVDLAGAAGAARRFSGICSRFSQGLRGAALTAYRAEVVPAFWLLGRRAASRIFQEVSVPEILEQAFQGGDVVFELEGTYHPRDYCVQYRESDFDFASRLMEEEGMFTLFRGEQLVVADAAASYATLPKAVPFEPSAAKAQDRVVSWEKAQELRAGKVTLRDYSFELPDDQLEARATIQESVEAGAVTHKLRLDANAELEVYDYPGAYAQRFDGVDPGGAERPGELGKILPDGQRTAAIRMQEEALGSLAIQGASTVADFASGRRFALQGHGDADGSYVLTSVQHTARVAGDARSATTKDLDYSNTFTCIPASLPFRPARKTPKPLAAGVHTAFVAGPAGEETFTDKYGRVKVKFHWDREGRNDERSSCWIRVAALHAGGERVAGDFHFLPEVGDEVVVAFEHGDPDRPIIVGSVWNARKLPPPEHQKEPPG